MYTRKTWLDARSNVTWTLDRQCGELWINTLNKAAIEKVQSRHVVRLAVDEEIADGERGSSILQQIVNAFADFVSRT